MQDPSYNPDFGLDTPDPGGSDAIQQLLDQNNIIRETVANAQEVNVHWRDANVPVLDRIDVDQTTLLSDESGAAATGVQQTWLNLTRDAAPSVYNWLDPNDAYIQQFFQDQPAAPSGSFPSIAQFQGVLNALLANMEVPNEDPDNPGQPLGPDIGRYSAPMVRALDELIASLRAANVIDSIAAGDTVVLNASITNNAELQQALERWNDLPQTPSIVSRLIQSGAEARLDVASDSPLQNDATLQHLIRFEYIQRGNELQFEQMTQVREYLAATDTTLAVMNKVQDVLMGKEAESAQLDLGALYDQVTRLKNSNLTRTAFDGESHWIDYANNGVVATIGGLLNNPFGDQEALRALYTSINGTYVPFFPAIVTDQNGNQIVNTLNGTGGALPTFAYDPQRTLPGNSASPIVDQDAATNAIEFRITNNAYSKNLIDPNTGYEGLGYRGEVIFPFSNGDPQTYQFAMYDGVLEISEPWQLDGNGIPNYTRVGNWMADQNNPIAHYFSNNFGNLTVLEGKYRDPAGWASRVEAWEASQFENRELLPMTGRMVLGYEDPPVPAVGQPTDLGTFGVGSVLQRYDQAFGLDIINADGSLTTAGSQAQADANGDPPPGTLGYELRRAGFGQDAEDRVGQLLLNHLKSRVERLADDVQKVLDTATLNRADDDLLRNLTELVSRIRSMRNDMNQVPIEGGIYDFIKDLGINNTDQGDFQKAVDQVYLQANASKDSFNEELRRRMFEFEEYYKSASAVMNKITQILEKIAQNIGRS